jgi:hypothetical protein
LFEFDVRLDAGGAKSAAGAAGTTITTAAGSRARTRVSRTSGVRSSFSISPPSSWDDHDHLDNEKKYSGAVGVVASVGSSITATTDDDDYSESADVIHCLYQKQRMGVTETTTTTATSTTTSTTTTTTVPGDGDDDTVTMRMTTTTMTTDDTNKKLKVEIRSAPMMAPGNLKPPVRRSRFNILLEDDDDLEDVDVDDDDFAIVDSDDEDVDSDDDDGRKSRGRSRCVRPTGMLKFG